MMRATLTAAALVACAAPVEPSASPDGILDPTPSRSARAAAAPTPATECPPSPSSNAREFEIRLEVDDRTRTARVHLPPDYDGTRRAPVVFDNHGSLSPAWLEERLSGLERPADARGMITVAPSGTGGWLAGWNAGDVPLGEIYESVDDVKFFDALLTTLEARLCVDPDAVYCAGFSLGGSMCYRLACDLSPKIAAIASVSGPDGTVTCAPERAVPLLHIHGTDDPRAAYAGDGGQNKGAPRSVADHAARNGCDLSHTTDRAETDRVACRTYDRCPDDATATLCTVEGGGHQWPGGRSWGPLGGPIDEDFDASAAIVAFFAAHRRSP